MTTQEKIMKSKEKFKLNLKGKTVLTEAATGNYVVTPIIAAFAGANVIAVTKKSRYGNVKEVKRQTQNLAKLMGIADHINIVTNKSVIQYGSLDIVTNTGFVRPIHERMVAELSPGCVIPLMWEPWEYRAEELDLEACRENGIKVYGTNENDSRLRTFDYIGYSVLYLLLQNKRTPFSSNVLIMGSKKFVHPVERVLKSNGYDLMIVTDYNALTEISFLDFDTIILLEHERDLLLIGDSNSVLQKDMIDEHSLVIHVAGNVNLKGTKFKCIPEPIAPFGYMSIKTDFIDEMAVIDLHTAGLKVGEGMLLANTRSITGYQYKYFMEKNFPALSFEDPKYY